MSGPARNKNNKKKSVFRIGQFTSPVKLSTDLFNQQLWCWGRDVDCEPDNLLLRNGFERIEKPAGSKAASIYQLELSKTARVILRGFGVFYGDDRWGGIFLQRYSFRPRYTKSSTLKKPAWRVEDLPKLTTPNPDIFFECRSLLADLIEWIYSYEMWVLEAQGLNYRQTTVNQWKKEKKKSVCAKQMATTWAAIRIFLCEGSEEELAGHWEELGILKP